MRFDGGLGDAEIVRDLLVETTRPNALQNLELGRRQPGRASCFDSVELPRGCAHRSPPYRGGTLASSLPLRLEPTGDFAKSVRQVLYISVDLSVNSPISYRLFSIPVLQKWKSRSS